MHFLRLVYSLNMGKKMKTKVENVDNAEKMVGDYKNNMPLYKEFVLSTALIIEKILNNATPSLPYQSIKYREKEPSSLADKLFRVDENGESYISKHKIKKFSDIEDLAGVRVIFYLESVAEKFVEHLREAFCVKRGDKNFFVKKKTADDGYNAIHVIISFNENRLRLNEYKKFRGLRCEIQLTTVLYHAWSELEHDVIYKPKSELKKFDPTSFDVLEKHFKSVMENHIKEASNEFESIYFLFEEIKKGNKIFNPNFFSDINKLSSLNEIYKNLELFEKYAAKFANKAPNNIEVIKLLKSILVKSKKIKFQNEKTIFGEFPGKTYSDISIKSVEILSHMRYKYFPDSFLFLVEIFEQDSSVVRNSVLEAVRKISKYNYYILNNRNFGLGVQKKLVDYIENWDISRQKNNIEIIKVILSEIFSPDIDVFSEPAQDKITLSRKSFLPSEPIKKLRRQAIDILLKLLCESSEIIKKIEILKILREAINFSDFSQEMNNCIIEDAKYLIKRYEKIIFKNGAVILEPPLVREIESQFLYFVINKYKIKELDEFIKNINSDSFYVTYINFLEEHSDFYEDNNGVMKSENKSKEREKYFFKIERDNYEHITNELNKVAKYIVFNEDWMTVPFRDFLYKIGIEKSDIAELLLEEAFAKKLSLKRFSFDFLRALRHTNNYSLWDKYTLKIIKTDPSLLNGIFVSLLYTNSDDLVRAKDINLLKMAVKNTDLFKKIPNKVKKEQYLRSNIFQALIHFYKCKPKTIENLIIEEIEKNADLLQIYFDRLNMSIYQNKITIKTISKKLLNFISINLIKIKRLDYQSESLLSDIGNVNFSLMMNIFYKRLKQYKQKKGFMFGHDRYESIPYHLSGNFVELVSNNSKQYILIITEWIKEVSNDYIFNSELGRLINQIGGINNNAVLSELVKTKKISNINKVINLFGLMSNSDNKLCFEIIENTTDKGVWDRIAVELSKTGTVMGFDGMLIFYESRLQEIQSVHNATQSVNIKKFCVENMIPMLESRISNEKERVAKDKKNRTINFEAKL